VLLFLLLLLFALSTLYRSRFIMFNPATSVCFQEALGEEKQAVMAELKNLVMMNESLKQQATLFKRACKAQMTELTRAIKRAEDGDDGDDDDDDDEDADAAAERARMREIEGVHERDTAKLAKMRQVLAQKNQTIARMRRQIDEIPTRAELLQYERRFVELYQLVAEKLIETRSRWCRVLLSRSFVFSSTLRTQNLTTNMQFCRTLHRVLRFVQHARGHAPVHEGRFDSITHSASCQSCFMPCVLRQTLTSFCVLFSFPPSFLQNEVGLLESICATFPRALTSKEARAEFLQKFAAIITNIESIKSQVSTQLDGEGATRDLLAAKHNKLLEKQRKYFKAVKDFQDCCQLNERLLDEVEAMQG
jgi:hypothetical protein